MTENPLGVKLAPRERLAKARATLALAARGKAVRGDDGIEVSIPNIIVAIVVSLVIIGSVIAGIVFVVPFAQNSTAQSDLQTVQSAQQVYYSQTAPPAYGSGLQLTAKGAILKGDSEIKINVSSDGSKWCAGVLSDANTTFWLYAGTTVITSDYPSTALAGMVCPTAAQVKGASDLKL